MTCSRCGFTCNIPCKEEQKNIDLIDYLARLTEFENWRYEDHKKLEAAEEKSRQKRNNDLRALNIDPFGV